ncbi:MAG: dTMP kinase [Phycisphaeraceae bacterium]|nr:dTMP kinase [Phycisphaeraceae bacterium]
MPKSATLPHASTGPNAVTTHDRPTNPPRAASNGPSDFAFLRALAGRFVVFEGPDGSGKSTQLKRLVKAVKSLNIPLCEVREPGGTPVGERIRKHIVLARAEEGLEMGVRCEMLLYMASRAELVEKTILPALQRGELVIADRFVASTLAYQGSAGGLSSADISAVARVATRNLQPDLVVVFDINEVAAAKRLSPLLDRMEAKGAEFHRKVRRGYLDQAKADPGRFLVVDASRSEDEVWRQLADGLRDFAERLSKQ